MDENNPLAIEKRKGIQEPSKTWWEQFCLRFNEPDESPSWEPHWWSSICRFPICPTYRSSVLKICIVSFFLLTWGILYAVLDETAGLNGELFGMTILVITSYLAGWLWLKLTTLPALIAMLLTGIIFQNLGLVNITGQNVILNQELRKISLVIILMRAGLGLDATVMKKHYVAILQIGLLPWLTECICIGISTHFLLDLPWIWSFLLGTMIASVSPAVVVPCLFRLREAGYGVNKGIPTLVLAAAAIDDSVSVATFSIILNYMFSTGSSTFNIIKGPLSIAAGIGFGTAWGSLAAIIPEKGDINVIPLRFLWLFLGGLFALFISNKIAWSGAGPLAIVSSGFMAAYFWSKQGWQVNKNPVSNIFRILWIFFEPILFAFTGAQVKISDLDPEVIKMGVVCLLSCLAIRLVGTFLMSFGCGLNKKEKLFIGVTWLAKATVQAALGPAALDKVLGGWSAGGTAVDEERYGRTILALSVLSVVISAPLGAILIAIVGPRLLTRTLEEPQRSLRSPDSNTIEVSGV